MAHPSVGDAVRQDIRTFEATRNALRQLKAQIEHVREDSVRNAALSQLSRLEANLQDAHEWTLPSGAHSLRLAVVGSPVSSKTQVINRFVYSNATSLPAQDGRYKKEVMVDGQSRLLLLRDITSSPATQVCQWADGFMLVFSVCDELSYNLLHGFHSRIVECRGGTKHSNAPVVLIGTQDAITDAKQRRVKAGDAQKLASEFGRLEYIEVNAIHGVNIERAFTEVIQRMVAAQLSGTKLSRTPSGAGNLSVPNLLSGSGQASPAIMKKTKKQPVKTSAKKESVSVAPLGTGRDIPIKQGFLNKRTGGLQKDWKRKFVTVTSTSLTYYPSMNGYMENEHGKSIALQHSTVKIPGQRPLAAIPRHTSHSTLSESSDKDITTPEHPPSSPSNFMPGSPPKGNRKGNSYDFVCADIQIQDEDSDHDDGSQQGSLQGSRPNSGMGCLAVNDEDDGGVESDPDGSRSRTSTVSSTQSNKSGAKKHRRHRSWGAKEFDSITEMDHFEFQVISLAGKTWHFEASNAEDRTAWVKAIEKQILSSLEASTSEKARPTASGATDEIRRVDGNDFCADCVSPNPEWASLNFGSLLCIQCSAVHRQIGVHLSRVRSLSLDEWSQELVNVMVSIGNKMARDVYEAELEKRRMCRLPYSATREDREAFIQRKYVRKEFLAPLPEEEKSLGERLLNAVQAEDVSLVYLLLAYCQTSDVNIHYGAGDGRTPLHISCTLGNAVITQLLIWNGADVNSEDTDGRIPMVYARTAKHLHCVDILLQNGSRQDDSADAPVFTDHGILLDSLEARAV